MESELSIIPSKLPLKEIQSKPLNVLSSIENETVMDRNKLPNGRNYTNDNISKRYCISQDVKDNFYAIRHVQRSEDAENREPIKTTISNKKTTNRGRKRLSSIADETLVIPTQDSKRKKQRQLSKSRNETTSLYQTCQKIWPESSTLGDLSYDNIKSLSDLLKIRLTQAKFKMMAKLDKNDELFAYLAEECLPPSSKPSCYQLSLSKQRNKSSMVVIGNSKNLFARQQKSQRRHSLSVSAFVESISDSPTSPNDDKLTSPHRNSKPSKDRKKKMPKTTIVKTKRITTPKRRSAAADVVPVVLSDGSSVYVCQPCNKKYKNRNGLAYHLERCKNSKEKESHHIECTCAKTNDDTTIIQCEKCHNWSHTECVGVSEEMSEETFCCSKCKESSEVSDSNQVGQDLLHCLLEAQIANEEQAHQSPQNSQYQLSQQQQDQLNQLKELLSQPQIQTQEDNTANNEEDEASSIHTSHMDDDQTDTMNEASQLHVWDDFNVNSTFEKDQWNEDEPFSSYDSDLQNTAWNMSDLSIFNQPPSLLFTETTLDSTLDDDALPLIGDLATPLPLSESTPACDATPTRDTCTPTSTNTPHNSDGLWFQFANFDNDYHCENSNTSPL